MPKEALFWSKPCYLVLAEYMTFPKKLERIVYLATGSRGILRLIDEDLSFLKKPTLVGFFYTDIAIS